MCCRRNIGIGCIASRRIQLCENLIQVPEALTNRDRLGRIAVAAGPIKSSSSLTLVRFSSTYWTCRQYQFHSAAESSWITLGQVLAGFYVALFNPKTVLFSSLNSNGMVRSELL